MSPVAWFLAVRRARRHIGCASDRETCAVQGLSRLEPPEQEVCQGILGRIGLCIRAQKGAVYLTGVLWAPERGLANHLTRLEQDAWRDGQAERVGGLEIDDELKLGRLLDR